MLFQLNLFENTTYTHEQIAEVVSIYIERDLNLCINYKPIFLLSLFSKILEKLIFVRICSHLEKYNMLNKQQFGFRKNMSTTQTICSIYERTTKNTHSSLYICCVFLDSKKAFDTVNHAIVRGLPLQLFKSYLPNRYQYTKNNNYKSLLLKSIPRSPSRILSRAAIFPSLH